jgi:hypothetical protein
VDKIDLASSFYIGVQEEVKPDGTQLDSIADTSGVARPAVIGIQRKQRSWREHWEHDDD